MSLHKSLVSTERLTRQRNVLTRWERIVRLKEEERWQEGRSAFALPKVKVVHHKRHKKKKEATPAEAAAEGEVAAATPTPTEEAPPKSKGKTRAEEKK